MFVFGGWVPILHMANDDQQEKEWKCTDSLSCWDVSENRWIPLRQYASDEGSGPRGRSGHCAAAMGDRMYVWSGRDGYRKAWSNQVCCRDMWLLETMRPEQPGKVQLGRATFSALEILWPAVQGADGYFLQIGFGDPKEHASAEKRGDEPALKQPVPPHSENEIDKQQKNQPGTTSLISTQGTTYTAPASSKPPTDESGLPQDLFEDSERNEGTGTAASPKPPGESNEEKKTEEGSDSSPDDSKKLVDTKEVKKEAVNAKEQNEDDTLPWFDIGIIKSASIKITHYFNENQQPLQKQLYDLIHQNAFKCVNDPCFTANDKVPLINGQTYRFRVAAINGLGIGQWSETSSFKTCVPGYPSAPSSIRITKSLEGAQLTWEPPANINISGRILEYSVYLAVKNQSANSADSQLAFMRVYCGPQAECQVPQANLGTAYVDQTNKPAIIFRIAARNEKGYGPATQVRWLQDQQKLPPVRNPYPNVNPGYLYQHQGPQQKRTRYDHH
uniref:Fibronectin type-III domain-containing protein n=1 Tax=Caenorhabditis tropicalis TaxID=1561998 RepID=A0A1I7SXY6_9PELO